MAGGQESTFGQGSLGNSVSTGLRSRKSGGGSAAFALSGSGASFSQGAFSLARDKALSGGSITSARGQVVGSVGASNLPSWVPAHGTFESVSLNAMADIDPASDPDANPNYPNTPPWGGVLRAGFFWSNCVYCPNLGSLGSLVMTMSGHNTRNGNDVFRYDVATRLFSRMSNPHYPFFADSSVMYSDFDNGEYFADATATTTLQDQPSAHQSYDHNIGLPGGVGGTGPSGGILTTVRVARPQNGHWGGKRSHLFKFDDPVWERFASNLIQGPDYTAGSADISLSRNKVYSILQLSGATQTLRILDLSTQVWSTQTLSQVISIGFADNLRYMASRDHLMLFGKYLTPSTFYVIDPDTGTVYSPGMTGTPPARPGGGEWVESKGAYYYYEGRSDGGANPNNVYKLTPPTNYLTDPWEWTTISLTGTAIPAAGNGLEHQARFRWIESCDCFLWWPTSDSSIQAFRLPQENPPEEPEEFEDEIKMWGPGRDGPAWRSYWHAGRMQWENAGGDWWDRSMNKQGTNHWATFSVPATGTNFDLSISVTDLVNFMLENPKYQHQIMIHRVPSSNGNNYPKFYSLESLNTHPTTARRPELEIVDQDGNSGVIAPVRDMWIVNNGDGTGSSNTSAASVLETPALMTFSFPPTLQSVQSANLNLRVNQASGGAVTLYVNLLRAPEFYSHPSMKNPELVQLGIAQNVSQDTELLNHQSVLNYCDFTSEAAGLNWFNETGTNNPYFGNPTFPPWGGHPRHIFSTWDDLAVPYVELFLSSNQSIGNGHRWATKPANPPIRPGVEQWNANEPPYQELYMRQLIELMPSLWSGMRPLQGVKHPGLAGNYDWGIGQNGMDTPEGNNLRYYGFEARVDSGEASFHPQYFPAFTYWYGCDHSISQFAGNGKSRHWRFQYRGGRRYTEEQYVKLNTSIPMAQADIESLGYTAKHPWPGLATASTNRGWKIDMGPDLRDVIQIYGDVDVGAKQRWLMWTADFSVPEGGRLWLDDGILRQFIDGVMVYEDTQVLVRGHQWATFQSIPWWNWFHGGNFGAIGPCSIRNGGICTATQYIGPPKVIA